MKNKYLFLLFGLLLLCLTIWILSPNYKVGFLMQKNNLTNMVQSTPDTNATLRSNTIVQMVENAAEALKLKHQELVEIERGKDEWRTPIEFYGKVIDENTNPVANAQIDFDCNDLSQSGTSFYHSQSDVNGLFSIRNINGKLLGVKVTKQDYYSSHPFGANFYYAGQNQNFVPDSNKPVIFRLKRKGLAESLIVMEGTFQISISGKPLTVDLKTGKPAQTGHGDVIFEFVRETPDKTKIRLYDWKFSITVPDGGLIQSTKELDFIAPKNGYVASDTIAMSSSLGDAWQGRVDRQYFLKFSNGNYGRIVVDLMSHNGSLKIQSFINPSGSFNLEFDPTNVIQPNQ